MVGLSKPLGVFVLRKAQRLSFQVCSSYKAAAEAVVDAETAGAAG